jgi:cellulase/cellobiase CelA1
VATVSSASPYYLGVGVIVTNDGAERTDGWKVRIALPRSIKLTGYWNADVEVSGGTLKAESKSYNEKLQPGTSTSFGFQSNDGTGFSGSLPCTVVD